MDKKQFVKEINGLLKELSDWSEENFDDKLKKNKIEFRRFQDNQKFTITFEVQDI